MDSSTGQEPFITRFHDPAFIPAECFAPPTFNGNVSPDGQAVTALLTGLNVELSEGDKDTAAKTAILRIPVTLPDPLTEVFLGYYVSLRGFVGKTTGARATVFMELSGTTKTIEFPFDKATDDDFREDAFSFTFYESVQEDLPDGTRIVRTLPPPPYFSAVVTLTAQRRDPKENVRIEITSIDIEINRLAKLPKNDDQKSVQKNNT